MLRERNSAASSLSLRFLLSYAGVNKTNRDGRGFDQATNPAYSAILYAHVLQNFGFVQLSEAGGEINEGDYPD